MAVETVKRGPFLALLVMLMILLHTSDCGATSATAIMKDNATSPYHGRMNEPGLMFDSEIIRMLPDLPHLIDSTANRKKPVVSGCDRPPRYANCLGDANNKPTPGRCATYTRDCNK